MAKLEYLPMENTWNLSIFIKAPIKSRSCPLVLQINFVQKIAFLHYLRSIFIYMFALFNIREIL